MTNPREGTKARWTPRIVALRRDAGRKHSTFCGARDRAVGPPPAV